MAKLLTEYRGYTIKEFTSGSRTSELFIENPGGGYFQNSIWKRKGR